MYVTCEAQETFTVIGAVVRSAAIEEAEATSGVDTARVSRDRSQAPRERPSPSREDMERRDVD